MLAKVNWNPSKKDMFNFGWVLMVGFGLIGLIFFAKGKRDVAIWIWGISAGVGVLAMVAPVLAKPFYYLWMGFGVVMGAIMSRVIMSVIFFGIITPVALYFKIVGRDALLRKPSVKNQDTYWHDHPQITDKKSYEHLF